MSGSIHLLHKFLFILPKKVIQSGTSLLFDALEIFDAKNILFVL